MHLTADPTLGGYRGLEFTDNFWTVVGTANALKTLRAGFTTVRNVGSANYDDVAIKQAIEGGYVHGPRIVPATYAIGATGGHCDSTEFPPSVSITSPGVADGAAAIRATVRKLRKYGAEVIKFCGTGGVLSKTDTVGGPAIQPGGNDCLGGRGASAGDEGGRARAWHIRHQRCHPRRRRHHRTLLAGRCRVVQAGHAQARHLVFDGHLQRRLHPGRGGAKNGVFAESLEKERQISRSKRETFKAAHAAGVKMIFGTDGGVFPNGDNARQFAKMVEWGMSPMAVIQAATRNAAQALGREKGRRRGRGRPLRRSGRGGWRSLDGCVGAGAPGLRDEGRCGRAGGRRECRDAGLAARYWMPPVRSVWAKPRQNRASGDGHRG